MYWGPSLQNVTLHGLFVETRGLFLDFPFFPSHLVEFPHSCHLKLTPLHLITERRVKKMALHIGVSDQN